MKYQNINRGLDSVNLSFQCSLSQYIAIISHVMCTVVLHIITDTMCMGIDHTIAGNTNEVLVDSEIINEVILELFREIACLIKRHIYTHHAGQ